MKILNNIFYDKKVNLLFQVRAKGNKGYLCGAYTKYCSDAKTVIVTMQLSEKYIKRCKKVINFDKCKFLEICPIVGHYRVKEKNNLI